MTDDTRPEIDMPYLAPGTPVLHPGTGEEGLLVHCWMNPEIGGWDCYVALFDGTRPDWRTDARPTVLRYASTTLRALDTVD
ncbi:MAG: hypothetical protein QNJ20_17885 [Paracoccaceae bacterium]|nr:hypothetical protein [Paracoccaceae bacterium]